MYRLFFFIFLLILSKTTLAQTPNLVFNHLSMSDGLSENSPRTILEDKTGFMWFGTEDGLNKYDGYKFTIYRNEFLDSFSISSRNIKFLYTDSKKKLWIVTSHGLNIYDSKLNRFYNFRNNKYPALKSFNTEISGIVEDKKGNIWVSTLDNGLYKIESLDKTPKRYITKFKDGAKHLYFLHADSDSTLLIASRDGLIKFNSLSCNFTDLRPQYGSGYEIRNIYKDESGNRWLCTTSGLRIIAKDGSMKTYFNDVNDPYSINGNNIASIIPYKDGNYLIGIDGGGISYFDVKNQKFYHITEELSSNNVICLYKDSKGDLWVGTYLNGINYSNSTTNLFVLTKNNLYSDKTIKRGLITGFLKDSKQNLWIASDGGGLYKRKNGSNTFIHYKKGDKGLSSEVIIGLMEDDEGNIWITTYGGGICKYDSRKDLFEAYTHNPSDPNSLFNNQTKALCNYQGKIWISGFGAGVGVLDTKTKKFKQFTNDKSNPNSIPSDWIQSFHVDREGTLWLATFAGLSKYIPQSNTFKNYFFENKKTKNTVDINTILDITDDSKGNLWFGTVGNGIVCFNKKDGSYKAFTTEDGLSNNCIKSIIEDNLSNLWLATNNGISRFNINTKKCKAYTIKDGLPPCSFYYNSKYKDEQGRIYFGANNGYICIDPELTGENKKIPPVVITNFKIFNQSLQPGNNSPLKLTIGETNEITLSYDQNSITFEFASLNFNSSQNNQYAYWLEGFDKNWYMAGTQRSATYTNLNPGTYIFRVKGSNNDNVWNEKGDFVKIIIKPPYWKSWWFNTLAICSFIGLLFIVHTSRTRIIRKKNIQLEETIKQRTSELEEANEQLETFVYKASHDIKGPLKSIIGLTTIGKDDVVKGGDPLTYFDHILKSTKKLDTLLKNLLEVTKVKQAVIQKEKVNFKDIVNEAISSFENFPGYERITFNVDIKDKLEFYSDRKLIYSLIQNLIENPIKYADHSKEICYLKISIHATANKVEMIFKDNGIGMLEEYHKKIFDMFFKINENSNGAGLGLYIVKTSVEKLKGNIQVESEPGQGTTFIINL